MKKLLLSCCFFALSTFIALAQQPHVFIIYVDDIGWGDLSINGHPRIKTPHIDSFAMHSRRLRFYSGNANCSPSRTALLTGRVPQSLGVVHTVQKDVELDTLDNYELRAVEQNMAQAFSSAGYSTIHAGKWHVTRNYSTSIANKMGFQYSEMRVTDPAWTNFASAKNFINTALAAAPDKPIFAYITPTEAHHPTIQKLPAPLDSFLYLYKYDTITTDVANHKGFELKYSQNLASHAQNIKYYYGIITSLDYAFGDFLGYLDSLGIRDSSIIIFSSDNGPDWTTQCWGTPGPEFSGKKGMNNEGGLRVPGFVQWKGRWDDGDTVATPTYVIDLLPTLAPIAGLELDKPYKLHGEDVSAIWDKTQVGRTKPMFWFFSSSNGRNLNLTAFDYPEPGGYMSQAAFIDKTGRYKIIAELECLPDTTIQALQYMDFLRFANYTKKSNTVFMYDLLTDPGETTNIAITQKTLFEGLWSEFYLVDKQVRRAAPDFACERKRYQNFNPCAASPVAASQLQMASNDQIDEDHDAAVPDYIFEEQPLLMKLFPNPAQNLITITSNVAPGEHAVAQIFSQTGALMHSIELNTQFEEVDIKSLPAGFYIVRVLINGQHMISQSFVKI
jgi:arylsulfatase A